MEKKKLNKDGLIPGQQVDAKTYSAIINRQRVESQKAVQNDKKVRKADKPKIQSLEDTAE